MADENHANLDKITAKVDETPAMIRKVTLFRITIGFWLLGMCNNYIYVIMLSAAHDIISNIEDKENNHESNNTSDYHRECTEITPGAILLADVIPTLIVKLIGSFLPFYVHIRILITILLGITSLIIVSLAPSIIIAIVGVCFAALNCGLGELTLLGYSTHFVLHAVAGWSSGTGGAGLVASFSYAGMTEYKIPPNTALQISISVPLLMAIVFWTVLKHPTAGRKFFSPALLPDTYEATAPLVDTLKIKFLYVWKVVPYLVPLALVYYFEYVINSGLFDKIAFKNTEMSQASQFRWFNAMYQLGVFFSRSSVAFYHFRRVWTMSVLQAMNIAIFASEAIYGFVPNVWIMFVLIFWEGLLGGAAYVNTFYMMSYMIEKRQRQFAISVVTVADAIGIVLAGMTSFPLHNAICKLPFSPTYRRP